MSFPKKTLFLILFLLSISFVSADFTRPHTYWVLYALENANSPAADLCRERVDKVIDGNVAADIPVLHYYDEQYLSYIVTHTRGGGFQACLDYAGTDPDLKCFCMGLGTHIVEDVYSHGGYNVAGEHIIGHTEAALKKYAAPNLYGHMSAEKDFENKLFKIIEEREGKEMLDKLEHYAGQNKDSTLCNNFFEQSGGSRKYFDLFYQYTNVDIVNDANIFCNGYKNTGFYDTVYQNKATLPFWFKALGWSFIIFTLPCLFLLLWLGRKSWHKYVLATILIGLLGFGVLFVYVFNTNQTWKVTNVIIEIPTWFGYLSISESDVLEYDRLIKQSTVDFINSVDLTRDLPIDDASGLTYNDRFGKLRVGTLTKAESNFKYIGFTLLGLFALFVAFLVYESLIKK